MKVVIFGGRDFNNAILANKTLDKLHAVHGFTVVIDGMARGADSLGHAWAQSRGLLSERFPANWAKYGRSAGPIRNRQMIEEGNPEMGIAFPGGRGTADMKEQLKKAGIKVISVVPITSKGN